MDKKFLTDIINGFGLRTYVDAVRVRRSHWIYTRKTKSWIVENRKKSPRVHPSLEFDGRLPNNYIHLGLDTSIQKDVTIWLAQDECAHPTLTIGDYSFIGRNTFLGVFQPIVIGAYVQVGAYCYIVSQNHGYSRRDIPIMHQNFVGSPIIIEDDVWLGTHVVVLPGVTIGKGAIVAAGAVVNKDIPSYEVWGGVPARFLKERP